VKIYATHSTAKLLEYKDNYVALREFIVSNGHTLTYDWLHNALKFVKEGRKVVPNYKKIYKECLIAMDKADLVIIDDTVSSFSTGHQITLSIRHKKPTLVLWGEDKNIHFENSFLHSIESEYLEIAKYTLETLEDVLASFINKHSDVQSRHRFNLVMSDVEKHYLEWAQLNGNISKTKVIRKSIRDKMTDDIDYQKYLMSKSPV